MGRIDVHAHMVPPAYRDALMAAGHSQPDGTPAIPEWSPDRAIEIQDANGIDAAVISVSSPGVYFGDTGRAEALARIVNDAGAELVSAHPGRFGMFASLPLPNIENTLAEIERAFDELNADGVVVMSSYDGRHLGDPAFSPVFEELDRRAAVIFLHPTSPVCTECGQRGIGSYPAPMLEFMFESTRTVADLIISGTLSRYRRLRLIVPHAGAALPTLSDRVGLFAQRFGEKGPRSRDEFDELLRSLYFDLAGFPVPKMLGPLAAVADETHVLYGSDWPFTPDAIVANLAQALDSTDAFDSAQRERVMRTNALELFPRFG